MKSLAASASVTSTIAAKSETSLELALSNEAHR